MAGELLVGAEGWEHPDWGGQFYPDDLPPEWRLTYYANEYRQVLLPFASWHTADEEQFGGWCDDVPERFRFVLDVTAIAYHDPALRRQLHRCQSVLDDRLAGVICWSQPSRDGRRLLRTELGDGRFLAEPVTVPGLAADIQLAEDGAVCCALVAAGAGHDLKWLRSVLESLAVRIKEADWPMLFFAGRPPPFKLMRDAVVLWQLLGGSRR